MTRYLLDTDTFSLYLRSNPDVVNGVIRHFADQVTISVITVQEVWDGWA
ncbi:MAG: hypothetical protein JWO38_2976, partial [Gemmataceae bacterium]|nr:hypothetical protein [Gemmataceae bacterium]